MPKNKMKYINLGCGSRFHTDWTNVDFESSDNSIIAHNLLTGIPFDDHSFDVVYHSHVLEHFSKKDGVFFLAECYRVLKPNGVIRVAVPDLENIAKEYIKNLELAFHGNAKAAYDYEWIKLELYDQAVRNESGGDMVKYLLRDDIPNEEYVFNRIGEEARNIKKGYSKELKKTNEQKRKVIKLLSNLKTLLSLGKFKFKTLLFNNEIKYAEKFYNEAEIGKFRLSGEIHQWMYDRYSLSELLKENGFNHIEVKDAFTSEINNWNTYELESRNGIVHKPDSLFIEARK